MEHCLDSRKSRVQMFLTVIGFLILGLLFCVVLAYVIYSIIAETPNNLLMIAVGVVLGCVLAAHGALLCWLGCRYYFVYSRKISFDVIGITLIYCNSKTTHYTWDDVADVSVCDVNQNYGGGFDTVIRLGLNTEISGPLHTAQTLGFNGYDRWRDGWYLFSNYKKVIYLDYSDSRFEHIQKMCNKEIIDRRTNLGKSFVIKFWDT